MYTHSIAWASRLTEVCPYTTLYTHSFVHRHTCLCRHIQRCIYSHACMHTPAQVSISDLCACMYMHPIACTPQYICRPLHESSCRGHVAAHLLTSTPCIDIGSGSGIHRGPLLFWHWSGGRWHLFPPFSKPPEMISVLMKDVGELPHSLTQLQFCGCPK